MSGKIKKNAKKGKKRVLIIFEIIVLIILSLVLYTYLRLGEINFLSLNNIKTYKDTGPYTNIALFGLDSREDTLGEGNHSDTIIIASINNKTNDVKLLSVYRDTLLQVDDGDYDKANAAYFIGGPETAINMLNKNLDLDITKYITINFSAITHTIDLLGGIDIEMTEEERVLMNGYIAETSEATKVWSPTIEHVTGDGLYHLNGTQATAFCRIRYTAGSDFKRTERQRIVLGKMIEKAKKAKLRTLNSIIKKVFPLCMTNFTSTNFLGYAFNIKKFHIVGQDGFPKDMFFANLNAGSCVIPDSLNTNVASIHSFLFGNNSYSPSDEVDFISRDISYITSDAYISGEGYVGEEENENANTDDTSALENNSIYEENSDTSGDSLNENESESIE